MTPEEMKTDVNRRIDLAEKVWNRRRALNLSRKQLAEKTQTTEDIITDRETADEYPDDELLGRLNEVLKLK